MLLRRRRSRGVRTAGGDGVLPLPVLQVVVRVARQCLYTLEAGTREGDEGSRSDRRLPQDRKSPSPILPNLWRTRDVETSGVGTDRRIRGDHPRFPVSATASCPLRRDGAAHARRASEIEGLSCRIGRVRRNHCRIERLCCVEGPPVRNAPPKGVYQKTNAAPCEDVILSTVNRTKMFYVKHFGTRAQSCGIIYSAGLKATSAGVNIPAAEGRISIWRLWNRATVARCPIETIVVPESFPARIS